jgi:hypothetical protein
VGESGDVAVERDHEGAAELADGDFDGEEVEEFGLGGLVELLPAIEGEGADAGIYERAKRLDEVIGEAEGVAAIGVVDAEGGMESAGDEGAGDGGAEDGVAVVEEGVDAGLIGVAAETVGDVSSAGSQLSAPHPGPLSCGRVESSLRD